MDGLMQNLSENDYQTVDVAGYARRKMGQARLSLLAHLKLYEWLSLQRDNEWSIIFSAVSILLQ